MASKKLLLPTALLLSVISAISAMAASAAPPAAGLVELRPDGTRTLFTTERLNRNDSVVAQYGDAQGAAKCCVALKILGAQRPPAEVSDALKGQRVSAYALSSLKATDAVPFVGGALVFNASERFPAAAERALRGDPMAAKMLPVVCTSSEGAHLLQLSDGKPQAHLYMHFDYEVEPTCSEEQLKRFR